MEERLDGFGARLIDVCRLLGSKRAAADAMGVSEDMVYRYCKGDSKPPFLPMVLLCMRAGVRPEWLAVGEGPMRTAAAPGSDAADAPPAGEVLVAAPGGAAPEETPATQFPDPQLLSDVIETLEEILAQYGLALPHDVKGRAIYLLYQFALASPSRPYRLRFARDLVASL